MHYQIFLHFIQYTECFKRSTKDSVKKVIRITNITGEKRKENIIFTNIRHYEAECSLV